ncbi:MAG: hypothetical protein GF364_15030 [Candidatus Lokiarchaeota archaeon]|nr:hypothetical protein [Candidatus Lokiarchaeota archaeon]
MTEIYEKIIDKMTQEGEKSRLYMIDVKNYIEYTTRILKFMSTFCETFANIKIDSFNHKKMQIYTKLNHIIDNFYYKVNYGITENLVKLAKSFKDINRDMLILLFNKGITNWEQVQKLDTKKLMNLLNMPRKQAIGLLNNRKKEQ